MCLRNLLWNGDDIWIIPVLECIIDLSSCYEQPKVQLALRNVIVHRSRLLHNNALREMGTFVRYHLCVFILRVLPCVRVVFVCICYHLNRLLTEKVNRTESSCFTQKNVISVGFNSLKCLICVDALEEYCVTMRRPYVLKSHHCTFFL